jgi:hypothetical protein
MTKATSVIKKVELTNQNNSKPPQFNGKAGDTYLMWSMKFKVDMVMKNLWEGFQPTFERKLPGSKDGPFDLDTEDGKDHQKAVPKNQKSNDAIRSLIHKCELIEQDLLRTAKGQS